MTGLAELRSQLQIPTKGLKCNWILVENSLHLHYNLKAKKSALHHSPLLPIPITIRITSEWILTTLHPAPTPESLHRRIKM
jgi:hypothetical protein